MRRSGYYPANPESPALVALKSAHTFVWFSVEAALSYVVGPGDFRSHGLVEDRFVGRFP